MPDLPIVRQFPALDRIARARFGSYPTPVDRLELNDGRVLFIKRDDRSGDLIGGNKVRGLEWLLGGIAAGDRVLTVGPRGSTHALATALCAGRLGARTTVVRWNQEMNAAARRVDARMREVARLVDARSVALAYPVAFALRARRPGTRWIPAGGASPLAMLGHVNAALELAEQVERGACPRLDRVVVPYGTGATAAGLALGFRIAALRTRVVAVRVVPRVLGRAGRLLRLATSTSMLIERVTGATTPRVGRDDVSVEHAFYGGGYGRALGGASLLDERALRDMGVVLDDTYSRKAFSAAMSAAGGTTLLWLTFDGRLLQD